MKLDHNMEMMRSVLVVTYTILLVLSWIATSLRCYSRAVLTKKFALDDWLILLTQCIFTAWTGIGYLYVYYGFGQNISALTPYDEMNILKVEFVHELLHLIMMCIFRVAAGIFFLRLTFEKKLRITIYIMISFTMIYTTVFLVLIVMQCRPLHYFWTGVMDPLGKKAYCVSSEHSTKLYVAISAVSLALDWGLGFLPMWILKDLKVGLKKKLAISAIIAINIIAAIVIIIRFPFLLKRRYDDNYTHGPFVWTSIGFAAEAGVGLVAVSVAALKPLCIKYNIRIGSSFGHSQTQNSRRATELPDINKMTFTEFEVKSDPFGGEPTSTSSNGNTLLSSKTDSRIGTVLWKDKIMEEEARLAKKKLERDSVHIV